MNLAIKVIMRMFCCEKMSDAVIGVIKCAFNRDLYRVSTERRVIEDS